MMQFLVRRFVKDYENTQDQQVRAAWGTLGSVVGMILNLLLACTKVLLGIVTGSVAVTADGVNNLSDAGGSLVALLSVRMAQKPYDEEHPFGHGRIEYLGALVVGCLIAVFGVDLLKTGVEGIFQPEQIQFSVLAVALMLIGTCIKLWMWRFYRYVGIKTANPAMTAAGQDSLSDALSTGAVAVSMIIMMSTGWMIDGYVGVVVALLVLRAAWGVLKDTVNKLLGGKPDKEKGTQILQMLLHYPQILGVHDFVMHDYGPGRGMASVHAEVSADANIVEIHEIIDRAEREISQAFKMPICIHMDPVVTGDAETDEAQRQMAAFLAQMTPPLKLHDFRRVPGEKQINLIFDVLLPASVQDAADLTASIGKYARELDERYRCVVHYDRDYFSHQHED